MKRLSSEPSGGDFLSKLGVFKAKNYVLYLSAPTEDRIFMNIHVSVATEYRIFANIHISAVPETMIFINMQYSFQAESIIFANIHISFTPESMIFMNIVVSGGEDGALLRPHIVFFGEDVPMFDTASRIVEQADILIVVGTSLAVYPAAALVYFMKNKQVPIYLVDPGSPNTSAISNPLTHIKERGAVGVPELVERLRKELE